MTDEYINSIAKLDDTIHKITSNLRKDDNFSYNRIKMRQENINSTKSQKNIEETNVIPEETTIPTIDECDITNQNYDCGIDQNYDDGKLIGDEEYKSLKRCSIIILSLYFLVSGSLIIYNYI